MSHGFRLAPSGQTHPAVPQVVGRHQHQDGHPLHAPEGRSPGDPTSNISQAPYPGDFSGSVKVNYSPKPDGQPDPGEIVWSWVPYEEDHTKGKDRPPVLLVGRDREWLLGLMLTSKDHDNDARAGEYVDIGTGAWDRQGRPSEINVGRVIRLNPNAIRREGAVLGKSQFHEVARALQARN